MIRNLLRAMALDVDLYNHVEATPELTGRAFLVVVVANALASVGT